MVPEVSMDLEKFISGRCCERWAFGNSALSFFPFLSLQGLKFVKRWTEACGQSGALKFGYRKLLGTSQ